MRRLLTVILGVAIGLLVGNSAIHAAPALDPRWQTAGSTHETSLVDRLTRSEKAPLLFVPDSVTTQPAAPATLVIVLPGLGNDGRDLAQEFVSAAEEHRWLLLAPSPDYDPIANETLTLADLRMDESLVALADPGPGPVAIPPRPGHRCRRFLAWRPERASVRASSSGARRRARDPFGGHLHDADELGAVPARRWGLRPLEPPAPVRRRRHAARPSLRGRRRRRCESGGCHARLGCRRRYDPPRARHAFRPGAAAAGRSFALRELSRDRPRVRACDA